MQNFTSAKLLGSLDFMKGERFRPSLSSGQSKLQVEPYVLCI